VCKENKELRESVNQLLAALKAMVEADEGGFYPREVGGNYHCQECATPSDRWRSQTVHNPGCTYVNRIEAAKEAIKKAEGI
jgi:hypothetical protein